MSYQPNYIAYEIGNFLIPRYEGSNNAEIFFLLLQNTIPDKQAQTFEIKVGKTRFLKGSFYSDCLKVILYLCVGGGCFSVQSIELTKKKDGTLYFDAPAFLEKNEISYEITNTEGYRYFKSKLPYRDARIEIVLDENAQRFSTIHRRINADDYEHLDSYYNKLSSAVFSGYFLLEGASDHIINYHSIEFFQSSDELISYIDNEFSATDGEIVKTSSIKELLNGVTYKQGHRQGCHESDVTVTLIHGDNINKLFRFIDMADVVGVEDNRIRLSDELKTATTAEEIEEIVDLFNESMDNCW